jgi:hypothetical protein
MLACPPRSYCPCSIYAFQASQAKDCSLNNTETKFTQMRKSLSERKDYLETVEICTGSKHNLIVSMVSCTIL